MLIVADENIPRIRECLEGVGEVRLMHGRQMTNADLSNANALLVRSITRVDRELLRNTPVRFVATATIGTDHLDKVWLEETGIQWRSAAGCNARSVAEYITTALLELAVRHELPLRGKTLGIIGRGNTGGGVEALAPALGLKLVFNDPPLERKGTEGPWTGLDDLVAASDFITCHVPLNRTGPDQTLHLIDRRRLQRMKPEAFLINASRGPVVDNAALLTALDDSAIAGTVLDVWENEPHIMWPLLDRVEIGTPHIAGYSAEGKFNGTLMVVRALREHFQLPQRELPSLPPVDKGVINPAVGAASREETLLSIMRQTWNINKDDDRLRTVAQKTEQQRGSDFDRLRREYPVRREFSNYSVRANQLDESIVKTLKTLGFKCFQD